MVFRSILISLMAFFLPFAASAATTETVRFSVESGVNTFSAPIEACASNTVTMKSIGKDSVVSLYATSPADDTLGEIEAAVLLDVLSSADTSHGPFAGSSSELRLVVDTAVSAGQPSVFEVTCDNDPAEAAQMSLVITTDGSESPTMSGILYIADHDTATSDTTYTLPAVSRGLNGCFYDFSGGTGKVILDPQAADAIVLNGTAASDDENIESPGGATDAGDFICIFSDGTDWYTLGRSGTWVEATP